jgi:type I restriction enzyme, S subunit
VSWHEIALGDAFTIKHGFAFKSQYFGDAGQHIVLTPGNFYEAGGFRERAGRDRYYTIDPPEDFILRPGDLVIAMTEQGEGLLGSSAIIPPDGSYLHNQRIGLIENLDELKLDRGYLYRLFNTPQVRAQIRATASGTKVRHTAPKRIYSIRVKVPPVTIQRKIAEALAAYDRLIENNWRRIALLEDAVRIFYREWIARFRFPGHEHIRIVNGLPAGWERRLLDQIVDVVSETVKPADFTEDDIHIGLEHIPRRSFTLADWEPAEGLASQKIRFHEGDILFGKIRPYFHKVGFALRDGLASSDALVWRVRNDSDWPIVVCATSSDHFVAVASKTVREGSKMPRADWNVLKQYVIPRPPDGLLGVFNDTIFPICRQCRTLALHSRTLSQARDLLLPRLMNVEIAV